MIKNILHRSKTWIRCGEEDVRKFATTKVMNDENENEDERAGVMDHVKMQRDKY